MTAELQEKQSGRRVLPPRRSALPLPNSRTNEGLGFVLDVPVELTVEIGRKTMKIAEVIALGPGSIIELDKPSGEPLDVLLNDKLVARGEAVVIGDRYGVRITEVFVGDDKRGAGAMKRRTLHFR